MIQLIFLLCAMKYYIVHIYSFHHKISKIMKFDEFHLKLSNPSQLKIYKFVPDSMKIFWIHQKNHMFQFSCHMVMKFTLNLNFQNFENHDFDDFCYFSAILKRVLCILKLPFLDIFSISNLNIEPTIQHIA